MVHIPTHVLSSLLPRVSTPLSIWRKFDKIIVVTEYSYKSLRFNTIKTWRLLMDPNKKDKKIPKNRPKEIH